MTENKYDDINFFNQYKQMPRSKDGLKAAGEWHALKKVLPRFENSRVLDLGCGFGWHCRYAVEEGAKAVVGVDISERMLNEAINNTTSPLIQYIKSPIEDINFQKDSFDIVISSLALHYINSFKEVCEKVNDYLISGGSFVFSCEHPIFTSNESQDWHYNSNGEIKHWPIDRYFEEGVRKTNFLGEDVTKYHRTLTTYINTLIQCGFEILEVVEPEPSPDLLDTVPGMRDELRRPMMLIISARKR